MERNSPPGPGGFHFTMFPDQEPCVRDFTTRCDRRILSWNLTHGSWSGNIVNRKPPGGGGVLSMKVCVALFLLNQYWGIVTVPGSFLKGRGPGVTGSSPSTLTTSLATPVPSSFSSNGPTTTPLTTRDLCPGGSVVWAGPKFVRPHWWES